MELLLRSRPSPAAAAAVAASIAFRLNPSHEEEEEEEEEIGVAMAGSSSTNAGMGWPLGLRSCMVAQDAASPRVAEEESSASIAAVAAAAQTSWLQAARLVEEAAAAEQHNLVEGSFNRFLPYLSDASVSAAESSESDSDFQSETVTSSSFFKDSRRITLGSLIGLPMEYSASGRAAAAPGIHHHHLVDTHNHGRRRPGGRWSFSIANRSCGFRELLGSCGNCLQSSLGESLSDVILMDPQYPIGMSGQSLAACLELERRGDAALQHGANQAASSADGDRRRSSPEWSATQFVSCDSLLSDAEEEEEEEAEAEEEEEKKGYGSEQAATPFSHSTFSTSRNSNAINGVQRSSSSTMKSFLSTICCHMHPHQQP